MVQIINLFIFIIIFFQLHRYVFTFLFQDFCLWDVDELTFFIIKNYSANNIKKHKGNICNLCVRVMPSETIVLEMSLSFYIIYMFTAFKSYLL